MRETEAPEWRQRLRYRFDRLLAHGTWATLLWLGIVTLGVVAFAGVLLAVFDVTFTSDDDVSFFEDFWQSLLRVLDPGTMAGDVGWGRRLLALAITLFGLLVAGTLIGIIAAGVEDRIERMRRGRSVVFESDHVVVLGGSDRLPSLVRQLVLGWGQQRGGVIVVLTNDDAADVQEMVESAVGNKRRTRLVFRTGDPTLPSELEMVRIREAEKVIVLSSGEGGDSTALRTVVAVESMLQDRKTPVVVELSEPASMAQLAHTYPGRVHPIVIRQAIHRIAAVALRDPTLGWVAVALLDDVGSDLCIRAVPSLAGRQFAEIRQAFDNAIPIGFLRDDGGIDLNPAPQERLGAGDRLILVSESEERGLTPGPSTSVVEFSPARPLERQSTDGAQQHLLVLGWSDLGDDLIDDWAKFTSKVSTVDVFLDPAASNSDQIARGSEEGPTIAVNLTAGLDPVSRRLESDPPVDTVLLLATDEAKEKKQPDGRTLLTLIELRRVLEALDAPTPRVLVEIVDVDSVQLVDLVHEDDFIVSDAIGSQLIAQLTQFPDSRDVLLQLFGSSGPTVHLIQPRALGLQGAIPFAEIYQTGFEHGVVVIGYRGATDGLMINPPRAQIVDLSENDSLVVIS